MDWNHFLFFYISTWGWRVGGGMVDKVNVEAFGCDLMLQIGSFGHLQPFFLFFLLFYFPTQVWGGGMVEKVDL